LQSYLDIPFVFVEKSYKACDQHIFPFHIHSCFKQFKKTKVFTEQETMLTHQRLGDFAYLLEIHFFVAAIVKSFYVENKFML